MLGRGFGAVLLAVYALCLLKVVLMAALNLLKSAVLVLAIVVIVLAGVLTVAWCIAARRKRLSKSKHDGGSYE